MTLSSTPDHASPILLQAGDIWQWFRIALEALTNWVNARLGPDFWADTALYLIIGGISVLSLVVFLVLLRSVFPHDTNPRRSRSPRVPARRVVNRPPGYTIHVEPRRPQRPPTAALPDDKATRQGRAAARDLKPVRIDELLDELVRAGTASPLVLRHDSEYTQVRLHACAGCRADGTGNLAHDNPDCRYHHGLLHEGFRLLYRRAHVVVWEAACHRRGAPACDFGVWHA